MTEKPKLDIKIDTLNSKAWKGIVWHHSASKDGITRDWDAIWKYHTSYRIDGVIVSKEEFKQKLLTHKGKSFEKPWKSVGYHTGTEWVNGQVIFNWGRPLFMIGSHAGVKNASNQFNEEYLGFCAIGNFDLMPPKAEHWDFNIRVTRTFMDAFRIPANHVIGHYEVFDKLGLPRHKTCPGKCWDMELFRKEL